jgi:hypothetical protein
METEVVKVKNSYTVKFTIGVQTFTLADYGVRTKKEAEWLEERLKEAFADFASQFKLLPVPSVTITDEEIEKWGDNMWNDLSERGHSNEEIRRIILNRMHGAKDYRDNKIYISPKSKS